MSSTNEKCASQEVSNVNQSSPNLKDLYRIFNDNNDISTDSTTIYNYLAEQFPYPEWTVMNYGFLSKGTDIKKVEVTNFDHDNPAVYCIRLYAAIIDDIVLKNLDVL
ncbi:unnamed protein product, partial [Adineta steineri]